MAYVMKILHRHLPWCGAARAERRRGRQSMAGRDARPDAQTGRRPTTPSLNTRSSNTRATPSVILQCLLIGLDAFAEQLTDRTGGGPRGVVPRSGQTLLRSVSF